MKYQIVTSKGAEQLEIAVNYLLDAGWELAGSLQVIQGSSGRDTFYQPMVFGAGKR